MTRLTLFAVVLMAGLSASAQHLNTMNPVRPMPAPPNAYPYGNILWPGGIPSFPQRVGGTVSGSMPYTGVPPGGMRPGVGNGYGGRSRTVVVPYAVPVYAGPYYGNADYYSAPQQPSNITVVVPQQPTPSVIINHNYIPQEGGKPVLRDYSNTELPETEIKVYEGPRSRKPAESPSPQPEVAAPAEQAQTRRAPAPVSARDDRPTIFLIALKDTTVRQAIGYWVEDSTLHYVTPQGSINHVTLDMVDKEMSVQLNSERNLEFDLNAAHRIPRAR